MQFPALARSSLAAALALGGYLHGTAGVEAQPLELNVVPAHSGPVARPLPIGASAVVKISLRNPGRKPVGPVEIAVRTGDLSPVKAEGWRIEDRLVRTTIREIGPEARVEREIRLRVETAPLEPGKAAITVEAKEPGGPAVEGTTELSVADCAGAYRRKLESLRAGLSLPARDAADEMRKGDPVLPASRQFPASGARGGEIARAERLAAAFAARRGADPQMATEWFRFLLQRWASELNAYAGQAANPGICANNYYQIAGYRQGLLPITRHIDAMRTAAAAALEAARKEASIESGDVRQLVLALLRSAEIEPESGDMAPLGSLAAARMTLRERKPDAATLRKFSLAETAAWLEEADRRGQKLSGSIEQVLATIADAHKESCVCAF